MALRGKNRSQKSISFEAAHDVLTTIGNVAASHALTVVTKAIPLPQNTQILRVGVAWTAVSGSPTLQLVMGTIAPGMIGSTDKLAIPGTTVFNGPVTLSGGPFVMQTIAPANMNVIYNGTLTARIGTTAADTATGIELSIEKINVDAHPTQPTLAALTPQDF